MTHNIYKFRAIQEKMFNEGSEMAKIKMQAYDDALKYFGDELVTKIQRHDGTFIFQLKAEVVEEMLRYLIIIGEAAETVYNWNCVNGTPGFTKKEKAIMYFVDGLKPDEKYLDSLVKCYKGSPMMSFYRDTVAISASEKAKAERDRLMEYWSF